MTDLFDAVAPDLTPRPRPMRGNPKGKALYHPCSKCGAAAAPFGWGVDTRKEKYGEWFCRTCLPVDYFTKTDRLIKGRDD